MNMPSLASVNQGAWGIMVLLVQVQCAHRNRPLQNNPNRLEFSAVACHLQTKFTVEPGPYCCVGTVPPGPAQARKLDRNPAVTRG